ncbi:hypothetical protein [Halopenitus persicus]|uniref:hypothetical protein n=1 Tax=Halopenitus persicus TaxID=1048396 RepID=UPI0012FD28DA|nr:hypothetical protein [Halopenitus persicus]
MVIPERYSIKKLVKGLKDPSIFAREVNYISDNFRNYYFKKRYRNALIEQFGDPIEVMEEDWDTLVILDACRYDTFSEYNQFEGDLQQVVSQGSQSEEWMRSNFAGREFHDTVYVSSNVYSNDIDDGTFYKIIKTYDTYEKRMEGRMPNRVTDVALKAHEDYPNKRLIVHYMQPHVPYIGDLAAKLRNEVREQHGVKFRTIKMMYNQSTSETSTTIIVNIRNNCSRLEATVDQEQYRSPS